MLRFKQFLLFEDTTDMGGNFDRRKRIVRPSPLTPDPAIRAFDLSQDFDPFAAFSDTTNMTDEEVVSAFEKYKAGNEMPAMKRLQTRLDLTAKEFSGEQLVSEKAKEIRAALMQERLRLGSPDITIDDATRLKPPPEVRAARGVPPDMVKLGWHNIGWWQDVKDEHRPVYYKPDIRGIFQPEPSQVRDDYLFKQVETPPKYTAQSTVGSMARPSYPIDLRDVKYGPNFSPRPGSKVTSFVDDMLRHAHELSSKKYEPFDKTKGLTNLMKSLEGDILALTSKGAQKGLKAASVLDPAAEVAAQTLPRAATAAGLGAEVAMGAAMTPLAVGMFADTAGDPMGDFKASPWYQGWLEDQKKTRASQVQGLIDRPYNPEGRTSRERSNN